MVESASEIAQKTTTRVQELQKLDVSYWAVYAQNYAQNIDLTLDDTVTECWDNSISSNASNKNIGVDMGRKNIRYTV